MRRAAGTGVAGAAVAVQSYRVPCSFFSRTIGPPPPQRASMRCAIPPPGTAMLGPPVPTIVLPLLACSRPPYLHRSDRRSCCIGGDLDGDATIIANKCPYAFLSFKSLFLLPIILTVF